MYRVSKHMFLAHFRRWTVWRVVTCETQFIWLLLCLSRNYECILPNQVFRRLFEIMRATGREHRATSSCTRQCERCIAENWQILMNKCTNEEREIEKVREGMGERIYYGFMYEEYSMSPKRKLPYISCNVCNFMATHRVYVRLSFRSSSIIRCPSSAAWS